MLETILSFLTTLFIFIIMGLVFSFTAIYFNQSPIFKSLHDSISKCDPIYKKRLFMYNFARDIRNLPSFWKQSLELNKWNEHSWGVGSAIYNLPYEELAKDQYLLFGLYSEPVLMYMRLQNDKDFAEILRKEISVGQFDEMIEKFKNEKNTQRDSDHYAEMITKIRDMIYL
jgi:hypothetical protein